VALYIKINKLILAQVSSCEILSVIIGVINKNTLKNVLKLCGRCFVCAYVNPIFHVDRPRVSGLFELFARCFVDIQEPLAPDGNWVTLSASSLASSANAVIGPFLLAMPWLPSRLA